MHLSSHRTTDWKRRRRLKAFGATLLVVLGTMSLGWLVRRHDSGAPTVALEAESEQAPAPHAFGAAPTPMPTRPEPSDHVGAATANMLTNYQKYAMYPPQSRPVTQRRADAFKYNHRVVQYVPVVGQSGDKRAFYSAFTADKVNVFEQDRIKLTLTAAREPNADSGGYPIVINDAGLATGRSANAPKVLDLKLRDDGQDGDERAGDFVYTAWVEPSKVPALADYHGSVRAFVEFSANGSSFGHQLFFEYYPPRGIAARFTGKFRETIEDGSLVVHAELDVIQTGFYSLDATLLTREHAAFCHSRFKGTLETGIREASFLFFGKIIRDANATSPFRMHEIYGQMVPAPEELTKRTEGGTFAPAAVPPYDGDYITAAYDVSQFSEAEWQSPKKDSMLDFYAAGARGAR